MREVSDRLCREYAISVIENPGRRTKDYAEWQAERDGKPTHRGTIRADIDRAIRASTTERDFLRVLDEMGYQVKTHGKDGKPLKYPALKPPDAKGYFRFHKLGEGYTLEEIRARILRNIYKQPPFPELVHHLPQHYRVRGKPQKKVTGLRALYFRYCYELHIIVKRPASVKRVSFYCGRTSPSWTGWTPKPAFGETPHRNDGGVDYPLGSGIGGGGSPDCPTAGTPKGTSTV
ncbi:relaxase/mobilization nuclease domain-containing protein [Flavonifractor plautii]|nr:relaxase/mobilization nuclease domain-containing protein [Flavonifractor plautii]